MDDKRKDTSGVNEEQISKWKDAYGEIYMLTADDEDEEVGTTKFYFHSPGHRELSRFAAKIMKDSLKGLRLLVTDCLLHPSEEQLNKILAKKPGLAIALGTELQKLVGVQQDFTSKKL